MVDNWNHLQDYINNFFGYGANPELNHSVNAIFVSLEEGVGDNEITENLKNKVKAIEKAIQNPNSSTNISSLKSQKIKFEHEIDEELIRWAPIELKKKLDSWIAAGMLKIEDIFTPELDNHRTSARNPISQKTWNKYIKFLPFIIPNFTLNNFGRKEGNLAIIDLFPLPCKNIKQWPYKNISNLAFLKDKNTYIDAIKENRIVNLKKLIKSCGSNLKCVIFFSADVNTSIPVWESIISPLIFQSKADKLGLHPYWYAKNISENQVQYFIFPHPVARTQTGDWDYYRNVIKDTFKN
jgi:hypothetical protein